MRAQSRDLNSPSDSIGCTDKCPCHSTRSPTFEDAGEVERPPRPAGDEIPSSKLIGVSCAANCEGWLHPDSSPSRRTLEYARPGGPAEAWRLRRGPLAERPPGFGLSALRLTVPSLATIALTSGASISILA